MLERFNHPVFSIFEQICGIPHGSGHTDAISAWLLDYAKNQPAVTDAYRDSYNNVVIQVRATSGFEQAEPVILQGHMDMVCEKEAGCDLDFLTEGLRLQATDEYVYAEGTTLGGDDGIALAMALALIKDTSAVHPPLTLIFTTDEETGMDGAQHLDTSTISARRMINIDSENEGIITCGCAGGIRCSAIFPLSFTTHSGIVLCIRVNGLLGGHSGVDIHLERANANKVLARILDTVCGPEAELISFGGGMMDNAIPREASALVSVSPSAMQKVLNEAEFLKTQLQNEYAVSDPQLSVEVSLVNDEMITANQVMTTDCLHRILAFWNSAPNGVQHMSTQVEGLVETSLNQGIVRMNPENKEAVFTFALRSAVNSRKLALIRQLKILTESLGGVLSEGGSYPAWEFQKDSPLRDLALCVYREQYGEEAKLEIIHAGLECGILASKIPGLDCISIGPDLLDIHTPKERLSVSSTLRVYRYIRELLKQSAEKK